MRKNGTLGRRLFRTAALLIGFTIGVPASAQTRLVSQEPYSFPFENYEAWLAFMDESPDPSWRSGSVGRLVPQDVFLRYKSGRTVRAERITYLSDGLEIRGFKISPQNSTGPFPVVVFAHGGVAEWGRITFFDVLEMCRLAERGYIVMASALRGEGGSDGHPNLGSGDRQDILDLLAVASHLDEADSTRIGYWGFSRGGSLGYRVLAKTDLIHAAVLIGAPSDLLDNPRRAEFHEHVYPGIVDGYEADPDAALRRLSAAYWPEQISPSTEILLIHGANDDRVRLSNSLTMADHFARLGRPFRLVVPEGGSHTLIEHLDEIRTEMDRWFDARLKR